MNCAELPCCTVTLAGDDREKSAAGVMENASCAVWVSEPEVAVKTTG